MSEKSIGDYKVVKQIGKGSLGTVFLAEHRFLKRPFALKVLPENLASDREFVERFEKEVAALATLDHPHIVKTHNVSFADGSYFLVTDCIVDSEGESVNLAQFLREEKEPLSEETAVRIVHQIASALDYAHQKEIAEEFLVHRGIKLNNVLISRGKDGIQASLSDFGLSRLLGADACSNFQDYPFLAPEQRRGGHSDARSDVYAFGVLVYYLILREFPEGIFEMPSEKIPEYKLNWDLLVTGCLQRDPEKRPASLKGALEELLSGNASHPFGQAGVSKGPKPVLKPSEIVRPEYEPDPGAIFQVETVVARYQPKQTEAASVEPLLTEMAIISGGPFHRGSNSGARDEMPRHAIQLSSFAIDVHPVTNEQFVRFLEAMGGEKDKNNNDIVRLRESRIKRSAGKLNIESGYAKHPVVGVTWYGAVAYAKWIGKRLPTEAEWEVAACGEVEESVYPTGKNIERAQANFFSSDTTAVMSYPPNSYGLYDMAGNVYDWCEDWYGYHYYDTSIQEPDNPKGPPQGVYRVLRGGCWKSLKEDLRCAHRHRNNPGTVNGTYGFRCAADVG